MEKVVGSHGNEECRQHVESDAPRIGDAAGESFQRARQHDEQSAARYGGDAVERAPDAHIQALLVRVERQHVKTVGCDVVGGTAESHHPQEHQGKDEEMGGGKREGHSGYGGGDEELHGQYPPSFAFGKVDERAP